MTLKYIFNPSKSISQFEVILNSTKVLKIHFCELYYEALSFIFQKSSSQIHPKAFTYILSMKFKNSKDSNPKIDLAIIIKIFS